MICGSPEDESTQIGALISQEHMEKVESYIRLGIEEEATFYRVVPVK